MSNVIIHLLWLVMIFSMDFTGRIQLITRVIVMCLFCPRTAFHCLLSVFPGKTIHFHVTWCQVVVLGCSLAIKFNIRIERAWDTPMFSANSNSRATVQKGFTAVFTSGGLNTDLKTALEGKKQWLESVQQRFLAFHWANYYILMRSLWWLVNK